MRRFYFLFVAWFLFAHSGESVVDPIELVTRKPFDTERDCVELARLLQAGRYIPFFFCRGSSAVSEIPELLPRAMHYPPRLDDKRK